MPLLADSSIWIDHLRKPNAMLADMLRGRQIVTHPFVIGEIAMGSMRDRTMIAHIRTLHRATVAHHQEVLALIERELLFGLGIGYIDAHLLAAARLTPDTRLWTRDRRLHDAAIRLGVGVSNMS